MTDDPKTPPKPEPETEGGDQDVSTDDSPPGAVPEGAKPGGMIGEGEPRRESERRGGMEGEG